MHAKKGKTKDNKGVLPAKSVLMMIKQLSFDLEKREKRVWKSGTILLYTSNP
jgi:hypothetical protein